MYYEPEIQGHNLLLDLADGISGINSLDQAVAVLIEWGFINADLASNFFNELKGSN